jgi:hypothetical protein
VPFSLSLFFVALVRIRNIVIFYRFSLHSIAANAISLEGAAAIADMLKVNKTLQSLECVHERGSLVLRSSLHCPCSHYLSYIPLHSLSYNAISCAGAAVIGDALTHNKTLQAL